MSAKRPFDVIVWGATGFTGRLIASYLANRNSQNLFRWAIAGRDMDKLTKVRSSLPSSAQNVPIIKASLDDKASLHSLAQQTNVVITAAGPFMRLGEPLVEACVANKTHYCDTTGETPFVRSMIDKYHAQAAAANVKIICCAGFDSVPSDLGALLLVEEMNRMYGQDAEPTEVQCYVQVGGKPSGGTLASALNMIEMGMGKQMANPYILNPAPVNPSSGNPKRALSTRTKPGMLGVGYDSFSKSYLAPFVMATVNTRIVRRSAALLQYAASDAPGHFRYNENMRISSAFTAYTTTLGLGVFGILASFGPTRNVLKKYLPQPGEGPSEEERAKSYFKYTMVGRSLTPAGERALAVIIKGGDPGYTETSKMIAEAGLQLANIPAVANPAVDNAPFALPTSRHTPLSGGVLTPASALGLSYLDRIRAVNIDFTVLDADHAFARSQKSKSS
eukprot:TRINITY_DN2247_c0_g1::TRINITY_DN2247_c0_g1_i1::g.6796::m.6796 TRINITY_DN2247_c0_g1::TRINITY_DN2247_c0_g1_i1::g.6796  ORF type:complete len:447 (-),score=142.84,sp/Q7D745/Y2525_MYCTO/35.59/3e-66,Saccharop_dh/PF03435.13/4.1e-24,NAD_binding_10/PF13460.1/5e-05,Epimerase/PF01370.16/0.00038,NmrA/PF05368.8/0.00099,3Beta_HSD/PF01073.14/0.015 TRINITY_DN2247_c0_g1_i1:132-1472(-)